jgi:transcriptional regulator with XRE-family HTH domain
MGKRTNPPTNTGNSNAREPEHMGHIVRKLALEKGFNYKQIAAILNIDESSVYRFYKRKILYPKELMPLSKAFGIDLFLLYKPDVPPMPNPLQAVVDDLLKQLKEKDSKLIDSEKLKEELLKQQGVIDELHRQLEYFLRR